MSAEDLPNDGSGPPPAAPPAVDNDEKATPPKRLVDMPDVANDLRKIDEILRSSGYNDLATADGAAKQHSVEELADALSDGEEPFFEIVDSDYLNDTNENINGGGLAYTAETVAAISSLMKGEESTLFPQEESNGWLSKGQMKKPKLFKREITLQERAAAMIWVYKDYLQEEEGRPEQGDGDEDEGIATLHSKLAEVEIPSQHEKELPSANPARNLRKEEIKVATLEKFCKRAHAQGFCNEEDDEDSDSYDGGRLNRPLFHGPTAATTTAAFRLKAEVALKFASSKTKCVVKKAAGVVKTKFRDRMAQTKDTHHPILELQNDYNFQAYHKDVLEESGYLIQDEPRDDFEYGITHEEEVGSGHGQRGRKQQPQLQNGDYEGDIDMVFGMHILDRDQTFKQKLCRGDEEEEEAIGLFNELCDELGVTPDTHEGLRHFYQHPRSRRYQYPIFHTKKFKRSVMYGGSLVLFLLIIASIISAASNGFEHVRQKVPPLPDWKAEENWREHQKLEWERDHPIGTAKDAMSIDDGKSMAGKHHNPHSAQQQYQQQNLDEPFQLVSEAYRPVWYDRSTGWTGQTYLEALSWCDSHDNYIPCPYEVYCPNENTLLAGVMDDNFESWAPVINGDNEWVQVGTGRECVLYSQLYGRPPEWGESGLDNEGITRHIMCCRVHPMEDETAWDVNKDEEGIQYVARPDVVPPHPNEGSAKQKYDLDLDVLYLSISEDYKPIWFDRDSGWMGKTYQDSLDFCALLDGRVPCPYDVYCPGGGGKLLGGTQDAGESWSAVIDEVNDWVQVGQGGECNLYSETEKERPRWGVTGENNEKITRHIMCCQCANKSSSFAEASASGAPAAALSNDVDMAGPPLIKLPEPTHTLTELEVKILDAHRPAWFDDDFGWNGTTWYNAKVFCESMPRGNDGSTLHLCPIGAYCPNGPQDHEPLYLQKDPFDGVQWAPISNEENAWIMVGKFSAALPLTCETYLTINHHVPDWGLDGASPELKKHILCCEDNTVNHMKGDEQASNIISSEGGDQPISMVVGNQPQVENSKGTVTALGMGIDDRPPSSMTDWEIRIEEAHHPAWFSRDFGWQGTTYDDAKSFCESIPHGNGNTLHLCPLVAYCPNGPRDIEPLYLQMDAFGGVQWAPISNDNNGWVMVGDVAGATCQTYWQINHRDPVWGLDGSSTQLKERILCCEDNSRNDGGDEGDASINLVVGIQQGVESIASDNHINNASEGDSIKYGTQDGKHAVENSVTSTFNPVWFDLDQGGWNGGSHDDGIQFCEQFAGVHGKRMELCPFAAYCPAGPSKPVIGGHMADLNEEGEQWAPVFGHANHWVMIGKREHNLATTCLSHVQLTGKEPSWGLDGSKKEIKKHIMCCSPFQ